MPVSRNWQAGNVYSNWALVSAIWLVGLRWLFGSESGFQHVFLMLQLWLNTDNFHKREIFFLLTHGLMLVQGLQVSLLKIQMLQADIERGFRFVEELTWQRFLSITTSQDIKTCVYKRNQWIPLSNINSYLALAHTGNTRAVPKFQ